MESQNKYSEVKVEVEQRIKYYELGFITLPEFIHSISQLESMIPDLGWPGIAD